jgi:hypothetical protein
MEDLRSGDDDACALFSSWGHRFWRSWSFGDIHVVLVLCFKE